jgi:hypothetical protein
VTSLPTRLTNVPAKQPAEYVRTITYFDFTFAATLILLGHCPVIEAKENVGKAFAMIFFLFQLSRRFLQEQQRRTP